MLEQSSQPQNFRATPGFLSTGESFLKSNNFVKIC